jgi:hypothetical protein
MSDDAAVDVTEDVIRLALGRVCTCKLQLNFKCTSTPLNKTQAVTWRSVT